MWSAPLHAQNTPPPEFSALPTINALTDDEHPCQILADIFTIQEKRGSIEGKIVTFVGDANSNTARSWIFAAGKMNFELRLAAPRKYQPSAEVLNRAGGKIICEWAIVRHEQAVEYLGQRRQPGRRRNI